jgi:spore maturation protein CgeB
MKKLKIVFIGLTITSSWGNGHATTFRGLIKALARRGHSITFLEKDVQWYADNRDLKDPDYCKVILYKDTAELKEKYLDVITDADLAIVGSYVSDGVETGWLVQKNAKGITAFYDIDTPVTLAKLQNRDYEYISPEQIPYYDIYLSFTGGPVPEYLHTQYNSPLPKVFYCSVDPEIYFPDKSDNYNWDMGYLGTYSKDRQNSLDTLFINTARELKDKKFIAAGPQYPDNIIWPPNVERVEHLDPSKHRKFYTSQRYTLNITRSDMIETGFSPSVRIFEAAACGTPVISDRWKGIETLLEPETEILLVDDTEDVLNILKDLTEDKRLEIGNAAMKKILKHHTADNRALQLEEYYSEAVSLEK